MIEVTVENNNLLIKVSAWTSQIRSIIAAEIAKQSVKLTNYVIIRHLTGGTTADKLKVRSGELRRTTRPKPVVMTGDMITGGVQFGANYSGIHIGKRGKKTVITPKRARNLAIPIMYGLTPAGVARQPSPRAYPFLRFIPRGSKPPLLAAVRKGVIYPYYVLVKSVTIPTRVHPEDVLAAKGNEIAMGLQRALGAIR